MYTNRILLCGVSLAICIAAVLIAALSTTAKPVPVLQPKPVVHQWPMFGGTPQRNMVNLLARNLPVEWEVEPGKRKNIKWVADLGSKAYGVPVIAGGRIFVGTNNQKPRDPNQMVLGFNGQPEPKDLGVIMCFRESDGAFLWQAVHEKLPAGQVNDWPREGICSAPVVEGERFYYVSNRCEVVCADVTNGKAIWTLDMIGKLGVFPHNISNCSPLLVGDHLWVVTSNGVNEDHLNVPAPKAPSFIKVDKKNGNVLWQDNSPTVTLLNPPKNINPAEGFFKYFVNRGELILHGQWANPAFAVVNGQPQVVFPGGDGWLYAFDLAGKLIWKFDANPKDAKYVLRRGERSEFIAAPVIYKSRVYIGVGQDPEHGSGVGRLWCIDMTKKGDVSAELRLANNQVVLNPNSAALWQYGGMIAEAALQRKLRRNYYFGRTMSTCAIHDDLVYAADLRGMLHCLDANTGKPLWEHDTESEIWGSPLVADGKVYLGTDDRTVWVFQHGRAKKVLAENEMEGRIRCVSVANDSTLYISAENRLYAIAKGK
jgi:outer membrane protein assembly factor BamB